MKGLTISAPHCRKLTLIWPALWTVEFVMQGERIFTLKLREEHVDTGDHASGSRATVGELWQGDGRVPVAGLFSYRGRVDAVITFFVDQFLNDEIFNAGDSLALALDKGEGLVLLTRRRGSVFAESSGLSLKPEDVL
jgi:hypothetical protein